MGIRTALTQARIVSLGVFAAAIWIVLTMLQVFGRLGPLSSGGVGQTPISGLVGLAVLGGALALLLVLYGELSETEPAPEPWE
ncbi:hypothetical protein DU500_15540 [Haloplanus rubicundus]|uniref:Uncharacterized protein n=1 Tax=Haloplanus rubicundus TaxID=1547898 RepID=A0A345E6A5_9EURY|nr:hypothetical protein [Haloplanus rubicundus]AXG07727.1 hypothetical protein DU500_15540 [Haloplanus rubicundus]